MPPLPVSPGVSYEGYLNEYASLMTSPLPTIIPRDASGKPGSELSAVDAVAKNIVRAINICRNMMNHPIAREAFVKIAQKYAAARPNVWFRYQEPPITTAQVADIFLVMVKKTFLTVFIDYALKNPDYGAYHSRRPWIKEFEPKHQAISINGMVRKHQMGFMT